MLSHLTGSWGSAKDEANIFTVEDLKDVLTTLPLQRSSSSEPSSETDQPDYAAHLVPSAREDAYYSTQSRLKALSDALNAKGGHEPMSIVTLAADVDVDVEFVERYASAPRTFHGTSLIPSALLENIEESFRTRARSEFVSLGDFARSSNIDRLWVQKLAQTIVDEGSWSLSQWGPEGGLEKSYFVHKECSDRITQSLKTKFSEASKGASSIEFKDEALHGLDRESFLAYAGPLASEHGGKFEGDGRAAIFVPAVTPEGMFASKVEELVAGQTPFFESSSLQQEFPAVFDGDAAVKSYFAQHPASGDLLTTENTVISVRWLSNAGLPAKASFQTHGYADLKDLLKDVPKKLKSEVTDRVQGYISGASGSKIYETFLIQDGLTANLAESAKELAAAQATTQWEASSRSTVTLSMASLVESLASKHDVPGPLVNAIYKSCLSAGARTSFSQQAASLEAGLMGDLAKAWKAVVLEWEVRSSALQSPLLQEPSGESLRAQLTEILVTHMLSDVIPPKLKTSGPSAAQRSSKATKILKEFSGNLPGDAEEPAIAMRKLQSAIEKLRSQLRISVPTADELEEEREKMLTQMRSQLRESDADGPQCLLLALLILHARTEDATGVLYSTGRCVPRLIRALRGRVNVETMALLNACKDQVKTGEDLSAEQKNGLDALVSDAN